MFFSFIGPKSKRTRKSAKESHGEGVGKDTPFLGGQNFERSAKKNVNLIIIQCVKFKQNRYISKILLFFFSFNTASCWVQQPILTKISAFYFCSSSLSKELFVHYSYLLHEKVIKVEATFMLLSYKTILLF